ncbi:MAG TPA: prolyl oligopeptidase family serine peptidase [Tepidisphaeraceae bacterium]|jgi:dienelactone hydrolase|nr:prolyl oligopeptidase family serine peptidase [Tepidisphaeraceae bacterium]
MSFLWYWPGGGWDFDKWKSAHPWEPIRSQQSGSKALVPLISDTETLAGWKREAEYWRGISDQILGTLADKPPAKVTVEYLGARFSTDKYTLQRLRYLLTPDEWGYAWLLVPKENNDQKKPAVIALHQTTPAGKDEAVGLELRPGGEYLLYGVELASQGFVVFAPDAIAFGERLAEQGGAKYHSGDEFFAANPQGSVMGKMAFDTSRAVDVLQSLDFVDGDRIGCIGHSHGAYGTLFAMIQDPRIKAGVVSCGVSLLRADPTPQRWWRMTALMPRLGHYEGRMEDTPIEFHQWIALVAPRPLMIAGGLHDQIFPNTAPLRSALEEVRRIYTLYGAPNDLHAELFDGPHSFPDEVRRRAYAMLTGALKH